MRAQVCTKTGTTYSATGAVFEDCGYHDDLDGNVLALIDKSSEGAAIASRFAQPTSLQGYGFSLPTDAQIRQFQYDPLGRLLSSQGFEHVNRAPSAPWDDTVTAQLSDPNDVRAFNETYSYDKTSGLQSLSHTPSEGTSGYTRNYSFASGSNRLASMTVGGTTYTYVYGPTGCMTQENTERHYMWDGARRLSLFKVQVSGSAATKVGQYLYDGGGERRVKIKSTTGRHEITYYLGAFELTRLIRSGQPEASNSLAFIHDAGTAIFRGRSGEVLPGESSRPAEQYTLSDHLGSASTTVDDTGAKISREAYTAYGESTYGSFEKKRYRFTGKERDEESGLNYHSARYYAPWLGKWLTPDPSGFVDGPNLYAYVRGNPVNLNDPTGNLGNVPLESDDGFKGGGGSDNAINYENAIDSGEPLKMTAGIRTDGLDSIGIDHGQGISLHEYQAIWAYRLQGLAAAEESLSAGIGAIIAADADLDEVSRYVQTLRDLEYFLAAGLLVTAGRQAIRNTRADINRMPNDPHMRANLGAGQNAMKSAENVDIKAGPGVNHVANVEKNIPLGDSSVNEVHAINPYKYAVMNSETRRVLKPNGVVIISGNAKNKWVNETRLTKQAAENGFVEAGELPELLRDHAAAGIGKQTDGKPIANQEFTTRFFRLKE